MGPNSVSNFCDIFNIVFLNSDTYNLTASQIKIGVGSNRLTYKKGAGIFLNMNVTRYNVNDIIVHEGYNSKVISNDIALIRVQTPIQFNDRVQPIKYTANVVPSGTPLQTSGFGWLKVFCYLFYLSINKRISIMFTGKG